MRIEGETNKQAIDRITGQMNEYLSEALKYSKSGDKEKETYYVAKALHINEDSRNSAHVQRDRSGQIVNINAYSEQNGTSHNKYEDAVFIEGPNAKSGHLRPSAVDAIKTDKQLINEYLKTRADGSERFEMSDKFREDNFKLK